MILQKTISYHACDRCMKDSGPFFMVEKPWARMERQKEAFREFTKRDPQPLSFYSGEPMEWELCITCRDQINAWKTGWDPDDVD